VQNTDRGNRCTIIADFEVKKEIPDYIMYCPNGNTAASCPAATFVDTGVMDRSPAVQQAQLGWVYSLVVNGKYFPVGAPRADARRDWESDINP
jgi:hypothetical protein